MVSCPNVKKECLLHCFHSVPHGWHRTCKDGGCPVTLNKCVCSEHPVQVNVKLHLREDGRLK